MSAIVPQNYEAVPLGEKFAWVHGQPGMRAVEAAADSVRTMGERLGTIATEAGRSMRGLGVTWAGPASEAAQRSSEQLVDRAVDTQSLADNGAARILDYGRSFDEMRTRVAFEDPSQLSWVETVMEPSKYAWDLRPWAEGEDHVSVLRRNQDHDAAANDALRWHEANARAADDGFVTDGRPPPAVPVGATAVGSESGGNGAGVGGASSAPPPVSAAAAAPAVAGPPSPAPISAPGAAAPSGPPGAAAAPVPGPPGAVPGQSGSGAGAGAARPGVAAGRGGSGTGGSGTGASGTGGDGRRGGTAGTTAPGAGGVGATGPAAAGGAAGAGGLADPVGERARRAEQFRQDLAAGSPAARTGPGTGAVPGGGWYGSGGRPGAGGAAANAGRLPGGWNPSGPEGSSPLTGGIGARPGNGAVGSRSGGGPGGWAPGGPGGVGDPSRLPGESGSRSWSRAPGVPAEGPLSRGVAGEQAVTGRGAGYGPGYAPMMGGAGGLRSDGDAHRNRYLLPTSEPFDVDLPHAPPVLAPEEDG